MLYDMATDKLEIRQASNRTGKKNDNPRNSRDIW